MKTLRFTAAAVLAAALLASCGQTATTTTTAENTDTATTAAGDCPVRADRNWHARVNQQPGPDRPPNGTLQVTGEVDFPTTGYTWTLTSDDVSGATVHLDLNTVAPAAAGDAITPTEVTFTAPAGAQRYTEITVFCGRGVLETITEIEYVH